MIQSKDTTDTSIPSTSSLPVIFFGSSSFVLPIIAALNTNYTLVLVITTEMSTKSVIQTYCHDNKIDCLALDTFTPDVRKKISSLTAPVAVLADFGIFLPTDVLSLFEKGIINIHPSLLPAYRGPTPVQTAIKDAVTETGVSIIRLDEELDHGPVLGKSTEPIRPTDTSESLYRRLFLKGTALLLKTLPTYLSGSLLPEPQDHEKATYTERLTRESGRMHVDEMTQETLDRLVRAYYPWPGVWTSLPLRGHETRVKFLPNHMIQAEGKKPVSYKDFLNGYPEMKDVIEKIS